MGFFVIALAYIIGGLTFIPISIACICYYSLWFLPNAPPKLLIQSEEASPGSELNNGSRDLDTESEDTGVEAHMTAWVTISREYFIYPAGGPKNSLNPPEKSATDEKLSQTESAYSSLYKLISNSNAKEQRKQQYSEPRGNGTAHDAEEDSIHSLLGAFPNMTGSRSDTTSFMSLRDEKKTGTSNPTSANNSLNISASKLNKYFAVLQHGNILLYSSAETTKVKHVIVIAQHVVMMWPPYVADAELFIKRNAICLVKRDSPDGLEAVLNDPTQPPRDAFFIYLDNCSEKEDLYFALIRASKSCTPKKSGKIKKFADRQAMLSTLVNPNILANPVKLQTEEIMNLIMAVHADGNSHNRWFNALVGRLFLAVKDTPQLNQYFRDKIVKKLAKVKRPMFLSEIEVRNIHTGHAAPIFTNSKLRELNPVGHLVIEAQMEYKGGFSVEIGTKAVLNLGQRFKKRDVSLILAVRVRKLEGKVVLKIKPPPSNRIWYAFESMPNIKLDIEPVVSTKQITYSIVTKAIESRILEIIRETVVMPFMDDLTFLESDGFYRGGIWQESAIQVENDPAFETTSSDIEADPVEDEQSIGVAAVSGSDARESHIRHRVNHASTMTSSITSEVNETGSIHSFNSATSEQRESNINISEHIGELKGFGFTPESRASAKNLYGSFKKWGSNWYMSKDKNNILGKPEYSHQNHMRSSSESSPTTPIQAPLPHTFPPEILNELNNGDNAPYAPAEMKLPTRYPVPDNPTSVNNRRLSTRSNLSTNSALSSGDGSPETNIRPVISGVEENAIDDEQVTVGNSQTNQSTPYATADSGLDSSVSLPPKTPPKRKPVIGGNDSDSSSLDIKRSRSRDTLRDYGESSDMSTKSNSLSKRRTSGVSIEGKATTVGFHPCPPTAATSTTPVVASQRKSSIKRKEVGASS